MPLLDRETDIYPETLLETKESATKSDSQWWAAHTLARREKELMRRLHKESVAFYGPVVEHRYRTSSGRIRVSYKPLFPNYVFVFGSEEDRLKAVKTNCISNLIPIHDSEKLRQDLLGIQTMIATGSPVTLEEQLEPGQWVRVKSGTLKGQEGFIIERRGERRLVVSVDFLQQGASVLVNDFEVEPIS